MACAHTVWLTMALAQIFNDDFPADGSNRITAELPDDVLRFSQMHQNSMDDITSFSRTTIASIWPN